jgi:hypothetical protein
MNVFGRVTAVVIAIILMFIVPMQLHSQQQDQISQDYVKVATKDFERKIVESGKITIDDYEEFLEKLNATGNLYKINITHSHTIIDPKYSSTTVDSTKTKDLAKYTTNTYTDSILNEIYNTNNGGIYLMSVGDYVSISIANKSKTIGTKFKEMVYNTSFNQEQIVVRCGGVIRNESN